jgi:electron transfer flavoprotein beta subunit
MDPETGRIKRSDVEGKLNPFDLYALEEALNLKERYGGSITVMTMGPPGAADVIKEAYSLGADRGLLISDRRLGGADVLATSYTLAQGAKSVGEFDLIICGKQTTDGDTGQVGSEMSEFLGIPACAAVTSVVEVSDGKITVDMDMPNFTERVSVKLPCLICVEKDVNTPRLPSYLKKKATEKREIKLMTPDDFPDKDEKKYGVSGSPTSVERIFQPESNDAREIWQGNAEELSEKIFKKLKSKKIV